MIHILYHIVISGWYGGESEYGDRLFGYAGPDGT